MQSQFERVAGGDQGPATGVAWDGSGVLFALPDAMVVRRWDPDSGETSDFRRYTGRVNGLKVAAGGAVFAAQESGRRVIEFVPDGSARITATRLAGAIHNFPCGLDVDSQQRVWFADSYTGVQVFGPRIYPLLEHASVLRLERDDRRAWTLRRITFDTQAPRAVLLSRDERTLYVSEGETQGPQGPHRGGPRELRAYPVRADGSVGPPRILHSFGADHTGVHRGIEGLCLDERGWIVGCGGAPGVGQGPRLYVFDTQGLLVSTLPFVADVAPMHCAYGNGALYVSGADGGLYRMPWPRA